MKRLAIMALALLGLSLLASCKGPAGPSGDIGAQGPSVYVVDSSGNRFYSGGTIDLGFLPRGPGGLQSKFSTYSFANKTGGLLSIAQVGGKYISEVSGEFIGLRGSSGVFATLGGAETLQEISVWTDLLGGTLPADGSLQPFVLRICAPNGNTNREGEFKKQLNVALTDSASENYNFTFEVYGIVAC
jgi:hypothetical protein